MLEEKQGAPAFSPAIRSFYEKYNEANRLATGVFRLEYVRTQEIVKRYLPPPPAVLLDVGGGPGIYAAWLAHQNYTVHLLDPVPTHLEHAWQLSAQQPRHAIASCTLGDARALPFSDACAESVLLLGPLYHLTDRQDRIDALQEARRVLRPGGVLFTAVISRFASALEGLSQNALGDTLFAEIVQRDLDTGHHRNPTENIFYFTEAYFHRVEEIEAEIQAAGLAHEATLALEGVGWLLQDFDAWWNDSGRRAQLLEIIRRLESERSLLGASAHIMAIARKS